MFGLFGKDWNVIAIMFERYDLYKVNGQRAKGGDATKARDGAKSHARTILWAVFDQQGRLQESGEGPAALQTTPAAVKQLEREIRTNRTVLDILKALETKEATSLAKPLVWTGYPKKPTFRTDEQ
jgi:hypothetical protein